jgi:hypothetical protein
MATLREDLDAAAQWISEALQSAGYAADFSLKSLQEIDRFFGDHSRDGKPTQAGLLSQEMGTRIFALGAYIGETIRRAQPKAVWQTDDRDPKGEMNVALVLPDGSMCWPVQRAMSRLTEGESSSIAHYAQSVLNSKHA